MNRLSWLALAGFMATTSLSAQEPKLPQSLGGPAIGDHGRKDSSHQATAEAREPKFDAVLVIEGKGSDVSLLYGVLTEDKADQDRRSDLVVKYAKAALEAAAQYRFDGTIKNRETPKHHGSIVFFIRDRKDARWGYHTGFGVEQLEEIVAASPEKARKLASDHAWGLGQIPNKIGAGEDGPQIIVRRQSEEEWKAGLGAIPIKVRGIDGDAEKKSPATLVVPNLKTLNDGDIRGWRLSSILPLSKIKTVYIPYPTLKQEVTGRMTDREVVGIFQSAKLLATSDMKAWHSAPGGLLILTTDNGYKVVVEILLGGRGRIDFSDRSLYFQYDTNGDQTKSTVPAGR